MGGHSAMSFWLWVPYSTRKSFQLSKTNHASNNTVTSTVKISEHLHHKLTAIYNKPIPLSKVKMRRLLTLMFILRKVGLTTPLNLKVQQRPRERNIGQLMNHS